MAASQALADALIEVRNQESRVRLLERILIMLLMENRGVLPVNPERSDEASRFNGGFDLGNGEIRLISSEDLKKGACDIPPGVAMRMFARTESDGD